MSKNITIQEGGVAKQLTVDKLKTNLVGGGTCLWVPEDGTVLGSKNITENGTYEAATEGLYGFSSVTVSGIGSVTGIGQDGNEHMVNKKGGSGSDKDTLVDTVLPSSIVIETLPTSITYDDGDPISLTGIVVKAYKKDGNVWEATGYAGGIIPVSELGANPTHAELSQAETDRWDVSETDLNAPIFMQQVDVGDTYQGVQDENGSRYITELSHSSPVYMIQYKYGDVYRRAFVSLASFSGLSRRVAPSGWSPDWYEITSRKYNVGDQSAYVGYVIEGPAHWNVDVSAEQTRDIDEVAAIAITGGSAIPGGLQSIAVEWMRRDGEILSDAFNIVVESSES